MSRQTRGTAPGDVTLARLTRRSQPFPDCLARTLGSLLAVAGCTERVPVLTPAAESPVPIDLEVIFPDAESFELADALAVSVVDAISAPRFGENRLRCGDLSGSRLGHPIWLDEENGPGFGLFREPVSVDAPGTVIMPAATASIAVNPWRAVLVHVEARAQVTLASRGLPTSKPLTLVEGCACVRLDPGASHPDTTVDAEIKQECAPIAAEDRLNISLSSPVPPGLRLAPCDSDELVAMTGRTITRPRFCVQAKRCDVASEPGCYTCQDQLCTELDDLTGVPVVVRAGAPSPGDSAVPAGPPRVGVTDAKGLFLPEIDLGMRERCDGLAVLGRLVAASDSVRMPVTCVPPMVPVVAGAVPLPGDPLVGFTIVPESRRGAAILVPAHLAALLQGPTRPEIVELGVIDGDLSAFPVAATLIPPNEQGLALHGFRRFSTTAESALLALATRLGTTEPRLRVLAPGSPVLPAAALATRSSPCAPQACGSSCTGLASCEVALAETTGAEIKSADLDGDGMTDLALGTDGDFPLLRYYGTSTAAEPLRAACTCSAHGRVFPQFELLELGGSPLAWGIDLAIGDGTGLYVRYADIDQDPRRACFDCSQPRSVWRLTRITALTKVRSSTTSREDLIAVGNGSPVPGLEALALSVFFGDELDLSRLEDQPEAVRRRATLSLGPVYDLGGPTFAPESLATGDFNGDGIDDVASLGAGWVWIWLGAHRRAFAEIASPLASPCAGGAAATHPKLAAGDLDGDGRSDLAIACEPDGAVGREVYWIRSTAP